MSLDAAIYAILAADPAVAALVAARIYPRLAPEAAAMPLVVWTRVSTPRHDSLDGPADLASPRVQVDCWAAENAGALALGAAVRAALDGYSGVIGGLTIQGIRCVDERDLSEAAPEVEAVRAFGVGFDFEVWHKE